ncbi:hypothetical protein JOS77_25730 [Chromobacterium haemolyticum]|nr:hypothetical protein JOS77_25730 [Chromobacterium haemolyticum]
MSKPSHVVNIDQVEAVDYREGDGWGGSYQPLTPALALDALPGRLGAKSDPPAARARGLSLSFPCPRG